MSPDQEFQRFVESRGAEFYIDHMTMNYRIRYKGHNFAIDRMSMLYMNRTGDYDVYFAQIANQFDVIDEAEYRERFTVDATSITFTNNINSSSTSSTILGYTPSSNLPVDPPSTPVQPKKLPKPTRDFVVKNKFKFEIDDCEI